MGVGRGALGAADVRRLAAAFNLRPTKTLGQNFVIDANTCRKIVGIAGVTDSDVVLEIGPGLGSLTICLLEVAKTVIAVEIDPSLAAGLPSTIGERLPGREADLIVVQADAARVETLPGPAPTALVANLPYNVAVPVLLHILERFPSVAHGVVMVQAEVADRLASAPGSKIYGIPSVKAAWWADVSRAGSVAASVFWPAPRVDSGLVRFTRRNPPESSAGRLEVFRVIDAAFAQRRKTLRAALSGWAGSPAAAEEILLRAGISPQARGEELDIHGFTAIADARGGAGVNLT
jgi:16S rRNA (adenine1518-N6/adenine1519-N6)-dimethyltransferase